MTNYPIVPMNISTYPAGENMTFASPMEGSHNVESMAFLVINKDRSFMGKTEKCKTEGCDCGIVSITFPPKGELGIVPGDTYRLELNGEIVTAGPVI